MSNLVVVKKNLAGQAVLSASNEVISVNNLKKSGKGQVFRSAATSVSVTAFFTAADVGCVSLAICNLTATATLRVRCYDAGNAVVHDTTAVMCCPYSVVDKINHSGVKDASQFSLGGGSYATLYFPNVNCVKIVADIVDAANTAGYIDVAYWVFGKSWSPQHNADYGANLLLSDTSRTTRTELGDAKTNRGVRYRVLSFQLSLMSVQDRLNLVDILLYNGTSTPLFISIFPDEGDDQQKQVYQAYGVIDKIGQLTRVQGNYDRGVIKLNEI